VIADDWPIPETSSLGAYQIALTSETDDDYVLARHVVRVSRYELPTFTVLAKPDRAAYLPDQPSRVTITANYLFGKPVPKGKVKIVRDREPQWNPKTRKSEPSDETVSQGEADANGTFIADLDLKADQQELRESESQRFQDIHFAAYYTDPGSGRTEQRRFDVRITREPIHIYLIHTNSGASSPVYVSTSYADGKPASAAVDIVLQNRTTSLHRIATESARHLLLLRERWMARRLKPPIAQARRALGRKVTGLPEAEACVSDETDHLSCRRIRHHPDLISAGFRARPIRHRPCDCGREGRGEPHCADRESQS
jgi:uncharacterized protein YfaS (alpha-2-macroglobulin family)